jgi:hypothetical protein
MHGEENIVRGYVEYIRKTIDIFFGFVVLMAVTMKL